MSQDKKSAREYPTSYFKILELFSEGQNEVTISMTYREAASRRHHFYTFFRALARDYTKDSYIAKMSDIANTVIISLSPSSARKNEKVELLFSLNPLEIAFAEAYESKVDKPVDTVGAATYDVEEIERLIAERDDLEN